MVAASNAAGQAANPLARTSLVERLPYSESWELREILGVARALPKETQSAENENRSPKTDCDLQIVLCSVNQVNELQTTRQQQQPLA